VLTGGMKFRFGTHPPVGQNGAKICVKSEDTRWSAVFPALYQ